MPEYLDILNEKGEKTGKSRTYADAHRLGLLHRNAHVWLLNSKEQVLLQKRSKNMSAFPGDWDISSAGHVSAGQSSLEAAQRETQEELGVLFSATEFKYLFTVETHAVLNQGTYIENGFDDIYLVHCDLSLQEFKLDEKEVEKIQWIDKEEFKKWTVDGGKSLVPHEEEYRKLLEYLSK